MTFSASRISLCFAPVAALLLAGCGFLERTSAAPPAAAARAAASEPAEAFSSERAWAHLRALAELGPRPSGSAASQAALEYIRSRLESLGLEIEDVELAGRSLIATNEEAEASAAGDPAAAESDAVMVRHLVGRIPSESPDSIILIAHYDTRPDSPGANDGASGVAVLLELAAQLMERPLPYRVEFAFLDAESQIDPERPDVLVLNGSALLADLVQASDAMDEIRLAVVFRQVGDAELTIGRDLYSNRPHRDAFFEAARDLGHGDAFPMNRGFVDMVASHRPLLRAGLPRVVAIMDPWYGGDEPPGLYWGGAEDTPEHCSEESLRAVGETALLALRRITAQLQKVDEVSGRAARRRAEALAPEEPLESESVEEPVPVAEPPAADPLSEEAAEPPGAAPEVQEAPETPAEEPGEANEAPLESS